MKRKILAAIATIMVTAIAVVCVPVFANTVENAENAGELEVNNTRLTATEMKPDMPITDFLRDYRDTSWFKVELPGRSDITITFANRNLERANSGWKVVLFNSEEFLQTEINAMTNIPIRTFPEKALNVPAGTYYVRVTYGGVGNQDVSNNRAAIAMQDFTITLNTVPVKNCKVCGGHEVCMCVGNYGARSGSPCDVDSDGKVTTNDALYVLKHVVGLPCACDLDCLTATFNS